MKTPHDWMSELRERGVASLASQLGLSFPTPRSLSPCPCCRALQRGSRDKQGPIGLRKDNLGWACFRCHAKGDALTLAAWVLTGDPKANGQWATVKARLLGQELRALIPPIPTPKPPTRPPAHEVNEVWEKSRPVTSDPEVIAWLQERALSPAQVAGLGLARALPKNVLLPPWAASWRASHRLLLPLFDDLGHLALLRARAVSKNATYKELCPKGFEVAGLVFANHQGQTLLQRPHTALEVVITEGAPDFLTWATRFDPNETQPLAVFGVFSGSWTQHLAARIPDHSRIALRTHTDTAGERYAENISNTLAQRCQLYRLKETHA
jgi:hypothetical protein